MSGAKWFVIISGAAKAAFGLGPSAQGEGAVLKKGKLLVSMPLVEVVSQSILSSHVLS